MVEAGDCGTNALDRTVLRARRRIPSVKFRTCAADTANATAAKSMPSATPACVKCFGTLIGTNVNTSASAIPMIPSTEPNITRQYHLYLQTGALLSAVAVRIAAL